MKDSCAMLHLLFCFFFIILILKKIILPFLVIKKAEIDIFYPFWDKKRGIDEGFRC